MSTAAIPPRPRLAAHVLARRHVIDGQEHVILHDQERDDVLQIGRREWGVIAAADGTRDVEGIVVAARREGAHARVEAVRGLLQTLAGRGMLEAGDPAEPVDVRSDASDPGAVRAQGGAPARVESTEPTEPTDTTETRSVGELGPRPLVAQPQGDLRCSGAGTCCRLYGTVLMSPDEFRRARALLPHWRVGSVPPERWVTPVRGSEPGPVLASIARDGACGFLQDDGLCAIHRVGGAAAKPWGCRAFPRVYVDDGVAVHVSFKPECPCVLAPTTGEPEPVVDPDLVDARSLPAAVVVDVLPDPVALDPGHEASRAEVREWIAHLAREPVPLDPAAAAWALADRIAATGSLAAAPVEQEESPREEVAPPEVGAVMPWVVALHRRAAVRAREHAAWRSEDDLVRRVSTALALLTRLLLDPEALAEALTVPPPQPEQEARFWRGGLHSYRWPRNGALVSALRDDALRIWVARSLPLALAEKSDDPDLRAPLALVEAMLRAHGIGAYVDDLAQKT